MQQFKVVDEGDDTLDVYPFDGNDVYGELTTIAKAFGVRRWDYENVSADGVLYTYIDKNTRLATTVATGATETQRISPPYLSDTDDIILAVKDVRGFSSQSEEVEWIDISVRSWLAAARPIRWTPLTGWSAQPVSSARIAISGSTNSQIGLPIRYTTSAGSAYLYAIVKARSVANTLDLGGPSLSGVTLTSLDIGTPEMVVEFDYVVPGFYAVALQRILKPIAGTYSKWGFGPASLVLFKAWSNVLGASTAKINVMIDNAAVDGNGVIPSANGQDVPVESANITVANYSIAFAQGLDITVTVIDATAENLTVSCLFVLH